MTKSAFDSFILEEYKNISNAHYNTGNSISQFFRYYLILMSVVIVILPVIFSSKLVDFELIKNNTTEIQRYVAPIFFTSFAFIGTWIVFFMSGLKANETLYARTVNGVRNYFKSHYAEECSNIKDFLYLPTETSFPKSKYSFFSYMVWSMVLINALYLFSGIFFFIFSLGTSHLVCLVIIEIILCALFSYFVIKHSRYLYEKHLNGFAKKEK